MDVVRLKNMRFFAHHGLDGCESKIGQRFEVDVEMRGSIRMAALSDDVNLTFDYNRIFSTVSEAVISKSFKLIETLAEEIAKELLKIYSGSQVRVIVRKPNLPVAGIVDGAEVEITRGPIQDQSINPA